MRNVTACAEGVRMFSTWNEVAWTLSLAWPWEKDGPRR